MFKRTLLLTHLLIMVAAASFAQNIPTNGLQIWLKADSGTTLNGKNVAQWADHSGNGYLAYQNASGEQPELMKNTLNGLPVVYFDGNDWMESTLMFKPANSSESTIFVVCKGEQIQSIVRIQDGPFDQLVYPWSGGGKGSWNFSVRNGSWKRVPAGLHANTWNLGSASSSSQGIKTFRQRKLMDTAAGVGSIDSIPLYLGRWKNQTEFTDAMVAEILVYNVALTEKDRRKVESYLAKKWELPLTPDGLVATSNSIHQIRLSWNDYSTNETGFEIYRSNSSGGGFQLAGTTTANDTTYIDTGLMNNTPYYYKVRAINSNTFSEYSNESSAKTLLVGLNDASSIDLYWNPKAKTMRVQGLESHRTQVKVYDLNGRLLKSEILNTTGTIDLQSLGTGLYWVEVHDMENGGWLSKKLVIH